MNLKILFSREKSLKHPKNQDAGLVSSNDDTSVLIIADGHGGAPYVRSSMGARIACLAAKKAVKSSLTGEELKAAIKDGFDRLVRKHLKQKPFEEWEFQKLGNRSLVDAYGTTLLLIIIHPNYTECLQLGDGGLHLIGADGQFIQPLPKDPHCIGNITSSMCYDREEAIRHMRNMVIYQPIAAAILFTDGYVHKTGQPYEMAALLDVKEEDILHHFTEILKKGRRGDDQTCIFVYDADIVVSERFQEGLARTIEEGEITSRKEILECEISRFQHEIDNVKAFANRFLKQNKPNKAAALLNLLQPDIATLNSLKLEYSAITSDFKTSPLSRRNKL